MLFPKQRINKKSKYSPKILRLCALIATVQVTTLEGAGTLAVSDTAAACPAVAGVVAGVVAGSAVVVVVVPWISPTIIVVVAASVAIEASWRLLRTALPDIILN